MEETEERCREKARGNKENYVERVKEGERLGVGKCGSTKERRGRDGKRKGR